MFQIDKAKCTGCRVCVDVCPVEAISMVDDKAEIDSSTCTDCGRCAQVCPQEAIYSEVEQQQDIPQQQIQMFPGSNVSIGRGIGRGLGRGKGRGMGRGPRDGRGGGRGGGGRNR